MTIPRSALKDQSHEGITYGLRLAPVHPGAVLWADFIEPMGCSSHRAAKALFVQQRHIDEIFSGKHSIFVDTTARQGLAFAAEPQFWLDRQAQYDIELIQHTLGPLLAGAVLAPAM